MYHPHVRNPFRDLEFFFCFWPPKSPPWPLLGSVRRLQHRSWAFLARFFTKHRFERAPKSNFRRSWLDFELILVPPTADFHDFFIRLPWTALTFSKKTPPTKNVRKPHILMFFAFQRLSARFENQWKIASNALFEQLTPQRALSRRHFRFSKRQNGLRGLSGEPREASWVSSGTLPAANLTPLARPWALLGSFGAALGRSCLALGDASSRNFSNLRLSEQIFLDLGSV